MLLNTCNQRLSHQWLTDGGYNVQQKGHQWVTLKMHTHTYNGTYLRAALERAEGGDRERLFPSGIQVEKFTSLLTNIRFLTAAIKEETNFQRYMRSTRVMNHSTGCLKEHGLQLVTT